MSDNLKKIKPIRIDGSGESGKLIAVNESGVVEATDTIKGSINISGDILPLSGDSFSLGTEENTFKDLYLSTGTLYMVSSGGKPAAQMELTEDGFWQIVHGHAREFATSYAAEATASFNSVGQVTGLTITNSGSGYKPTPRPWAHVSASTTGEGKKEAKLKATIAGGELYTLSIIDSGMGYPSNGSATVYIQEPRRAFPLRITQARPSTKRKARKVYAKRTSGVITGHWPFLSRGYGYTEPPTVTVVDKDNTGSGAVVTASINEDGQVDTLSISVGGSGYNSTTYFEFSSPSRTATATASISNGAVSAITIAAGVNQGTGYEYDPKVTISGGGGTGAKARVKRIPSNGKISTTVEIISGGSGYTSTPTVTIESPEEAIPTARLSVNSVGQVVIDSPREVIDDDGKPSIEPQTSVVVTRRIPEGEENTEPTVDAGNPVGKGYTVYEDERSKEIESTTTYFDDDTDMYYVNCKTTPPNTPSGIIHVSGDGNTTTKNHIVISSSGTIGTVHPGYTTVDTNYNTTGFLYSTSGGVQVGSSSSDSLKIYTNNVLRGEFTNENKFHMRNLVNSVTGTISVSNGEFNIGTDSNHNLDFYSNGLYRGAFNTAGNFITQNSVSIGSKIHVINPTPTSTTTNLVRWNSTSNEFEYTTGNLGGGSQSVFTDIAVNGQDTISADSTTDTLNLTGAGGITITTNSGTDTVTISGDGGGGSHTSVYDDSTAALLFSGNTFTSFTSGTITPSSTSSKILINANVNVRVDYNYTDTLEGDCRGKLARGVSDLGNEKQLKNEGLFDGSSNIRHFGTMAFNYIDSPNSTSAQTYSIELKSVNSTVVEVIDSQITILEI